MILLAKAKRLGLAQIYLRSLYALSNNASLLLQGPGGLTCSHLQGFTRFRCYRRSTRKAMVPRMLVSLKARLMMGVVDPILLPFKLESREGTMITTCSR